MPIAEKGRIVPRPCFIFVVFNQSWARTQKMTTCELKKLDKAPTCVAKNVINLIC